MLYDWGVSILVHFIFAVLMIRACFWLMDKRHLTFPMKFTFYLKFANKLDRCTLREIYTFWSPPLQAILISQLT